MTNNTSKKTLFINKHKRANSELFDEIRLKKGLSKFKLASEVEMSPQTVGRILSGGDSRPSTIKKMGEFLKVPADKWYVKRNFEEK